MNMDERGLLVEREAAGVFWILGKASKKCQGTLILNPLQPPTLKLEGELEDSFLSFAAPPPAMPCQSVKMVIYGELERDHRTVSLHGCACTWSDGNRSKYRANAVLFGIQSKNLQATVIKSAHFRFEHLERWVGINNFDQKLIDGTWWIAHKKLKSVDFRIPSRKVTVKLSWFDGAHSEQKTRTLTYRNVLHVDPDRPMRLPKFRQLCTDLQRLLILLTGRSTRVVEFAGRPGRASNAPGDRNEFEFWYRQHGESTLRGEGDFILIPFLLFKDRLANVVNMWLLSTKKLKHVYDVYFGEMLANSPYLESNFFHIAQSLEAFHAALFTKGKFYTRAQLKKTKHRIVARLPKQLKAGFRKALESKIDEANRYTYRERIVSLFAILEPATASLVTDDVDLFVRSVKDSRNKFAHLIDVKHAFPEECWFDAIRAMQKLLVIHMLKLCGFEESFIRDRIGGTEFCGEPYHFHQAVQVDPPPVDLTEIFGEGFKHDFPDKTDSTH